MPLIVKQSDSTDLDLDTVQVQQPVFLSPAALSNYQLVFLVFSLLAGEGVACCTNSSSFRLIYVFASVTALLFISLTQQDTEYRLHRMIIDNCWLIISDPECYFTRVN